MKELIKLQKELKAAKSKYNLFGKFRYRSLEDILEAVKPFLSADCSISLTDEIVQIGDRYYIKATAQFSDGKGGVQTACGWAREAEKKSGMDEAQITGAASSYARKYALNALLLIDDTADADTDAYTQQQQQSKTTSFKKQIALSEDAINGIILEANSCTTAAQLADVYKYHAGKGEWCERLTEAFKAIKKSRQWN
jgi:hypothetical protein